MKAEDIRNGPLDEPELPELDDEDEGDDEVEEPRCRLRILHDSDTESSGSASWDYVRQFLPEHARNDPKVAEDLGFLAGMATGSALFAIIREYFANRR